MRGFRDYRKLTMVGVGFGLGQCLFGGQVLCSVVKSRGDRFRATGWCLLGNSGDQTVSLAVRSHEKVTQASLGERSELAGGKTKGVRALTKGQRDKNTREQWEHRPCGFPEQRGVLE